ncbi:unnamed protein product, partial [Laminaria digitata]
MSTIPLGPFELEAPIGRGGMGEVWRALHVHQQVPVAVKVLTREGARRAHYVTAFRNEVLSIARMHHPGVIVVLDYGTITERAARISKGRLVEGSPYLVMELARYGSLGEYRMSLRWPELRAVLLTVLDALAHSHARGVIHRDLKPQNILLGCGEQDAVKLTDFGLAHPISGDYDASDDMEVGWGTPAYMAPEQFRGFWRDYGPWTDLYAIGVMAYELACGRLPFEEENRLELGRAHIMSEIPRVYPSFGTPHGFESWVLRLLQKEPLHRFQRAADASLALVKLGNEIDDGRSERLMTDRFGAVDASMGVELSEAELVGEEGINPTVLIDGDEITKMIVEDRELVHEREGSPRVEDEPTHLHEEDAALLEDAHVADTWIDDSFEAGFVPEQTDEEHVLPALAKAPPVPISWRRRHVPGPSPQLIGAGLGLFGLRQPDLVGRDAERDLMWEAMRQVVHEQKPRAILLRGSSGVGKSRLAEWFTGRAHELGSAKVLQARHSPMRSPFDGIIPMLARHIHCVGMERDAIYERVRRHLESIWVRDPRDWALLTDMLAPEEPGAMTSTGAFYSHAERHAVIARILFYEADDRPVILWFDDVQWGAESLMLMRALFEFAEEHALPVLILMTLREESLDPRSLEAHLLEECEHDSRIYQCHISPLERRDSRELVQQLLALDEELTVQ